MFINLGNILNLNTAEFRWTLCNLISYKLRITGGDTVALLIFEIYWAAKVEYVCHYSFCRKYPSSAL